MRTKKLWSVGLLLLLLLFSMGCGASSDTDLSYIQLTAEEAWQMMEELEDEVVLDVRRQDEYAAGHIPGAVLLSNEDIQQGKVDVLPDQEQVVMVYCRSGNRSQQAAEKLVELGYSKVYEFGGIVDWPYEIEEAA